MTGQVTVRDFFPVCRNPFLSSIVEKATFLLRQLLGKKGISNLLVFRTSKKLVLSVAYLYKIDHKSFTVLLAIYMELMRHWKVSKKYLERVKWEVYKKRMFSESEKIPILKHKCIKPYLRKYMKWMAVRNNFNGLDKCSGGKPPENIDLSLSVFLFPVFCWVPFCRNCSSNFIKISR